MREVRFLNVSEYGVPTACVSSTSHTLKEVLAQIDARCGTSGRALQLATFGPSDLLTLHFVPDIRYLATIEVVAEVNHQRAVGAVVVEDNELGAGQVPAEAFLTPNPERPLYVVVNIKLDPLAKLLTRYELAERLRRDLVQVVADKSQGDPPGPGLKDLLEISCLPGLDTAELMVLARGAMLDDLATLCRCLQKITLNDLFSEAELHAIRRKPAVVDLVEKFQGGAHLDSLKDVTAVAYLASTVGMPVEALLSPAHSTHEASACALRAGVFFTRLTHPMGTDSGVQDVLRGLHHSPEGTDRGLNSFDVSIFGTHGTLLATHRGLKHEGVWTLGQVSGFLAGMVGLSQDDPRGVHARPSNNTIVGVELPQSAQQPGTQGCALRRQFEQRLFEARREWLGNGMATSGAYEALRKAAKVRGWAYSRTNAALNLLLSLMTLLSRSTDFENYIDLLPILTDLLMEAQMACAVEQRDAVDSVLKHLDRMLRLREGRERADRSPRLSRSTEARAGYIGPRDAFLLYLQDIMARRMPQHYDRTDMSMSYGPALTAPLLVDGADPKLKVKYALSTGMFYVSAQRLVEVVLWPSVVHEVEHVRLRNSHYPILEELRDAAAVHLGTDPAGGTPEHLLLALEPQFEEILSDLALFDGAALNAGRPAQDCGGHRIRFHRFLITMFPNLVMDLHDTDHARLADEPHLLRDRAMEFGVRLQSVWVLSQFTVGQGITKDACLIKLTQVLGAPDSWWTDLLTRLLCEVQRRCAKLPPEPEEVKRASKVVNEVRQQWLFPNEGGARIREVWAEHLVALHSVRSPDNVRPESAKPREAPKDTSASQGPHSASEPVHADPEAPCSVLELARYLERLRERLPDASPNFALPEVSPRGGLTPNSELAKYQQSQLWPLLKALQPELWAARIKILTGLFHGTYLEQALQHADHV